MRSVAHGRLLGPVALAHATADLLVISAAVAPLILFLLGRLAGLSLKSLILQLLKGLLLSQREAVLLLRDFGVHLRQLNIVESFLVSPVLAV